MQWQANNSWETNNSSNYHRFLAAGDTVEEVLNQYPSLEQDAIRAALEFASQMMDNSFAIKTVA